MQLTMLPISSSAEIIITGICRTAGSGLSRPSTSKPLISGIQIKQDQVVFGTGYGLKRRLVAVGRLDDTTIAAQPARYHPSARPAAPRVTGMDIRVGGSK
jgi:hypothetical protein